jgi:integrase
VQRAKFGSEITEFLQDVADANPAGRPETNTSAHGRRQPWTLGIRRPETVSVSITKRDRKRVTRAGGQVVQTRFVVNFREPRTGRRKQLFYVHHKDAVAMRDTLLASIASGTYTGANPNWTVGQAVAYWLQNRRNEVKNTTRASYEQAARYITGPFLMGSKAERRLFAMKGQIPKGREVVPMLGPVLLRDLLTADIRQWHKFLSAEVSAYTANVAKKYLRAALALAAEDYHAKIPLMPTRLGHGRTRPKKLILSPEEVGRLLRAAWDDAAQGIYYAFPFLTGTRPSEQLALVWSDVDLVSGSIHIQRALSNDGAISSLTKTPAGDRKIPMSPFLLKLLSRWAPVCPTRAGEPAWVFPALGRKKGGSLSYANFRSVYWQPALARLGLPIVTPHSARHCFISTLQAQGVEVGLVAQLAGHANAIVTIGHYTQAVRGGTEAVKALETAYGPTEKSQATLS